jgi:hypothetical protein
MWLHVWWVLLEKISDGVSRGVTSDSTWQGRLNACLACLLCLGRLGRLTGTSYVGGEANE